MLSDKTLSELVQMYNVGERSGSASLDEMALLISKKYFVIPKEDRRYCLGDMDTKDFGVLRILSKHNIQEKEI